MKGKIILTVLWVALWLFLSEYLLMPTWSFSSSPGPYLNLIVFFGVIAAIWYFGSDNTMNSMGTLSTGITGVAIVGLLILCFASCGACHSEKLQGLIGEIKETEFTANVQPIAADQMLIVDEEIAHRIGEKELGSDPGLGSRCELGKFTLQAVNGKLYWIAPLEHSGFWRWNSFSEKGTPGYIRVSATNQEDYGLVKTVEGKEIHIRYQNGAFFGEDLVRHIYTNGYRSKLLSDYTFEVDDQWRPMWTVTVYETKVGANGEDATGVLTVDPETGAIKEYSITDAPAWIDRIQPAEFVKDQVDDWGEYIHGWWNWSKTDVKRVADTSSLVLGADGRSYYYFGLKSAGNENSTVGFVMVDTRTKKAHWFKQSGATESAAKGSAEGKVQEKGYVGSDGITYNIDGHATYEFLLKDKAGLMKQIALVSVHDHSIVGIGQNRHEAIQDYRTELSGRGNSVSISTSDVEQITTTSRISRLGTQVTKGTTLYYLVLEKSPKTVFTTGPTLSNEICLAKEGDLVKVKYISLNTSQEISLTYFDDLDIGVSKDSVQIKNETSADTVRAKKVAIESEKVVDKKWESLSAEEKKKLLNKKKQ